MAAGIAGPGKIIIIIKYGLYLLSDDGQTLHNPLAIILPVFLRKREREKKKI